jgi:hypothetical protein
MATPTKEMTPIERWKAEIDQAEKGTKKFHQRGRKVTKKYLDERDATSSGDKWFNIFFANAQILESALYAQIPKPSVSRKFKDYDDEVARVAGLILQRSITQDLDDPRDTFDSTMRHCVQDRLVPGLGTAWLRLETSTEDIGIEAVDEESMPQTEIGDAVEDLPTAPQVATEVDAPEPLEKITDQQVCVDYVFWEDFIWSPCRVWEERRWVGRRVYMDRDELIERFGKEKGENVSLNATSQSILTQGSTPEDTTIPKAVVYEIWVRATKKVIWVSKGYDEILDEIDDPLGLVGFEPCPKPMFANISTSNTVPRPDYYMIQDQYTELDTINNRISLLVRACKVVGVYDKSAVGVARMLKEGFDNDLIPVDNWAMFAEKGGLKGQLDWLPLDMVVTALQRLNEAREVIKGQIYELTGIADIVRGATKASETLGAQQIKAQFASIRIKKLQDEVARFASEIMRIKAEIQIKHFDPQILLARSNIMRTSDAPMAEQAIAMLQSEEGFEWRVQVTADTIAQADYTTDKQDRIEMLTSVSGYLGKAAQVMQSVPDAGFMLVSMLKWAVAGFRNATEIEGVIDQELDKIGKLSQQPKQPPPPDPQVMKDQQDGQLAQARLQFDQQSAQQTGQLEQAKLQQSAALEQAKLQHTMQLEQMKAELADQQAQRNLAIQAQQDQMQRELDQAAEEYKRQLEIIKLDKEEEFKREMESQKLAFEKWKAELDYRKAIEIAEISAATTLQTAQATAAMSASKGETVKDSGAGNDAKAQKATLDAVVAHLSKPKKLIRGSDGKVSGIA